MPDIIFIRAYLQEHAKFRYFIMDNSLVLGLLEGAFNEGDTSPLPMVTAVVRSLTGRHVWSMQLRTNPRSQQVIKSYPHLHADEEVVCIAVVL